MKILYLFILIGSLTGCQTLKEAEENPPAPGFDLAASDSLAMSLADQVMIASGGRKAWDKTRYLSWNFFGRRNLIWDKHRGRVRIEIPKDSTLFLVNVNTLNGKASIKGKEILNKDSLQILMKKAQSIWINDSYWLVMPFKLKDTGVSLKYDGVETLPNGKLSNVLKITFSNVGDTPENMYRVFVDPQDSLIKQWSYYKDAKQDTANFTLPWDNYQPYGQILLSADRSDGKGPKNVRVYETLPDEIFDKF